MNISISKNNKQVVTLFLSTIIGVLLGVLSSVINTRSIEAADYGDVRYVQNLINLFSCLFLLGFFVSGSRLLAISKEEEDSRCIKGVMVRYLGVTVLMMALILIILYAVHLFYNPKFNASLFLLSIPVCAQPLMLNYINTTAQGDNQINQIAVARLLPALLYVAVAYFLYSICEVSSGLMILTQWGIACIVFICVIISTKPKFSNFPKYNSLLKKENKSYGIHLYLGSISMVATQYISGVTLGIFNDDNINVAFYTLALTISMPLAMLPSIVGTTYFKKFASEEHIDKKVAWGTIGITLLSYLIYIAVIQPIVSFLYPSSYHNVGVYASLLAIAKCVHGLGDMVNRFLCAHGKGKEIRNASFVTGGCLVFGSIFFVYIWGIWGAILTNVISSSAYTAMIYLYYKRYQNVLLCKKQNC